VASAGLSPKDPELLALLNAVPPERLRSVALFAAGAALRLHPVTDAVVLKALVAVQAANWPDALACGPSVAALAEHYDALYLEQWDAADGHYTPEVIEHFGRARALMSLAAALRPHPTEGALEAVYEAYTAHESGSEEFLTRVKDMLRSRDHR
jgi:hypothetical protein